MDEQMIEAAKIYINDLFRDNSDGHDAQHSLRVYRNALDIAGAYPECDLTTVALSALLHDVDDHKLFDTKDNQNARRFLADHNVDPAVTERICEIINGVSFSKNRDSRPSSIEGKIVQDADRLDAMGAVGIARAFAYGGRNGRTMDSSLQHFGDKLLLLKDMMNTEKARQIAEKRHAYMEGFLDEYRNEAGTR